MEILLSDLSGTPVFLVRGRYPQLARVYGNQFNEKKDEWYFPAYPPFGSIVLADFKRAAPEARLAPEVLAQADFLARVPELIAKRELPPFEYVTPPFDHQISGLAEGYYNPRWAFYWEAGTAKTKVIVDLARLLRPQRFLVINPKVTVMNWVEEVGLHAGAELRAIAIRGDPEQKRKIIREHKNYDILSCSYGTARNYGLAKVLPPAMKLLRQAKELGFLSESMMGNLGLQIRKISDSDRQCDMVWAKLFGATLPEVTAAVEGVRAADGAQWLEDMAFDVIVADESHNIKETSSTQTKAILGLSKRATRRYLLDGTPSEGNPLHMYPQLRFLAPCLVPEDWIQYANKFLVRAKNNKRIILGFQNLNLLAQRIQKIASFKKKSECLDLPERLGPIDITVELSAEQKRIYNTLVSEMGIDLDAYFGGHLSGTLEVQNAATLLNKLAQVSSGFLYNTGKKDEICNGCPHLTDCVSRNILPYTPDCKVVQVPVESVKYTKENPKLDALKELLDTILGQPTAKVIIWAVYHPEMDAIEKVLQDRDIGYVRVDGNSVSHIHELKTRFNTDPHTRVYLGQIATGIGITLNAAAYMIYYAFSWSLLTWLQSMDRNYRAGQTEKTTIYRLLGKGTVDEYKARALSQKRDLSATLNTKLTCVTCPKNMECLEKKIELFDDGCIHKRSARKLVARAEVI